MKNIVETENRSMVKTTSGVLCIKYRRFFITAWYLSWLQFSINRIIATWIAKLSFARICLDDFACEERGTFR